MRPGVVIGGQTQHDCWVDATERLRRGAGGLEQIRTSDRDQSLRRLLPAHLTERSRRRRSYNGHAIAERDDQGVACLAGSEPAERRCRRRSDGGGRIDEAVDDGSDVRLRRR